MFELLARERSPQITAGDDITVPDRPSSGVHGASTRRAHLGRDAEQPRAFLDQSNTTCRARPAEQRETLPNRVTAPGEHHAPFRIGVDSDDFDFVPIGLQFSGHDPAKRGTNMLPHLGANNIDRHRTTGTDAIPDGWLE